MQTKTTNIIKRIVDMVLTVLLLFLMALQVTGDVLHEWLGIGMTVTLVLHHILLARRRTLRTKPYSDSKAGTRFNDR